MTDEYTISPSAVKSPDDTIPVEVDLYAKCANLWRANEDFTTGEFIYPTTPNGFSYEVTSGGRTGAKEPRYPTTLANTVTSGSATLTCRAASAGGLNSVTSPSAVSDPTGLTISNIAVSESRKITANYTGGTLGQDYDVVYTFTLAGLTRVARHRVEVRKK